jgi:AraC-like DNA-binding protein
VLSTTPTGTARRAGASENRFEVERNRFLSYEKSENGASGGKMPVLPIPMVTALVLGFLVLRSALRGETRPLFLALIAACTAQSAIIALVQHSGVGALRPVQPVTATLIPVIAWLAFVAGTRRPLVWQGDAVHALGPVATTLCVVFAPDLLDIIVPALFAGYGAALLLVTAKGVDALPQSHLGSGDVPLWLWRIIAANLVLSALSDGLILLAHTTGYGSWQPLMVALFSTLTLLGIGALSLSRDLGGKAEEVAPAPEAPASANVDPEQDLALMARLAQLMAERTPYLHPDLTLTQLARKLTVPAKQLSAAINRVHGENVSRHINRYRIEHAGGLLRQGKSVTAAMFESGFSTKSNFNREFLRIMGTSPSEWLSRPYRDQAESP